MIRLAETSDWLFVEKQIGVSFRTLLDGVRRDVSGEYFASVYNLDDEVAGPFLMCKNQPATECLRNAYGSNLFLFTFYCWGKVHTSCPDNWTCDLSIAWDASKSRAYPSKTGKKSMTQFFVQKRWGDFMLLECRTNYLRKQQLQIHSHFSYFDILGDTLWCAEPKYLYLEDFKNFVKKSNRKPIASGLHLHLTCVEFSLNGISANVFMPPPKAWNRIEKFLQKYAKM